MSRGARPAVGRPAPAALFAALGDATRLALIERLAGGEAQSITRLTAGLRMSRQAITKHLRVLAGAGLVSRAVAGRETRWTLAPQRLAVARQYLELMDARWERRLESLRRHLGEPG